MAKPKLPPLFVTMAEAGEELGVGAERVRQFIKEGLVERGPRGKVSLVSAYRGYVKFLKDDERRSSKSASASRVQDARAREIELKVAAREGRLVDVVEHLDLFAEVFGSLKAGLAGIPARVSRDMAHRRKIETEIDDVLRQAADRFEQASRHPGDVGPASEADG